MLNRQSVPRIPGLLDWTSFRWDQENDEVPKCAREGWATEGASGQSGRVCAGSGVQRVGCFHCPGLKRQPHLCEKKLLVVFNYCNILKRCDSKLDVFVS